MPRNTPFPRSLTALAAMACALVALLPSTVAPPSAAAAAAADGQLSGRVQDGAGVNLSGADVALTAAGTDTPLARTTTDSKGAYKLAVPQGDYDATVTAPGATGTTAQGRLRGISVSANSKLTIALVLSPTNLVTFSGTIRDRDGLVVPGVTVNLSSTSTYKSTVTTADGRFSLAVPAGRQSLGVSGYTNATGPFVALPASWGYYTNAFDLTTDRSQDITIPGKDVAVRTESGAAVTGAPVNAGTFSTNYTTELFPGVEATSMWNVQGTTDASGKLKFTGLPADSLYLNATPGEAGLSPVYKTVSLSRNTTFNLVTHPTVTFSGVARDHDGSPLAGASVSLNSSETNISVNTASDGRFTLSAPKGTYTLWLTSYPLGNTPPSDTIQVSVPLELTGDRTQDLTVPGTILRAHVTDPSGAAVAGATASAVAPYTEPATPWPSMTLFPGGTGSGYRQSYRTTDGSGNALLVVVPESTVTVSARSADRTIAPAAPRQMAVSWGMACPGGDRDWSHPVMGQCVAEMRLRPTVSVHGVVDAAAPRADTRLYVYDGPFVTDTYEATTATDGSYELRLPVDELDNLSISTPCCSNNSPDRPGSWTVQGGPLQVTGDTTLDITPPFVQASIRAYAADGQALSLGATSANTENGSGTLKGSLGPGLPARSGSFNGNATLFSPTPGGANRLSVLSSVPFRLTQYYNPGPNHSGLFPTLSASGLSVTGDSDIALVISTVTGDPPSSTTTTTQAPGSTTTTFSNPTSPTTTTTTRPSGPTSTTTTSTSTTATTSTTAPADGGAGKASAPTRSGYWMVTAEGEAHAFGDAKHYGQPLGDLAGARAVDLEPTRSGLGYWVLDDRGRVHPYGDARNLGDADPAALSSGEKAASLSATVSGTGYWIFTDRGRVLTFGDAAFYGDMSKTRLNGPVLGSVATPSGKGYWMVASDGGIFSFGDATFHGSTGKLRLNKPVMGMAPAPGGGYWLVASDGGIFAFDVPFFGSMGAVRLNKPISGMVPGRNGYLMVAEDGGIFSFGDVAFHGSLGARPPASPVVSVALNPGAR